MSTAEAAGIPGVAVKCVELGKNTRGESALLGWFTDTKGRKLGERMGLDTPVVLALNDGDWVFPVLRRRAGS